MRSADRPPELSDLGHDESAPAASKGGGGARCVAGLDGPGGHVREPALAVAVLVVADALHVDGAAREGDGDLATAAAHRRSLASATSTSAATAAATMQRSMRASVIGAAPVPESYGRRPGQRS